MKFVGACAAPIDGVKMSTASPFAPRFGPAGLSESVVTPPPPTRMRADMTSYAPRQLRAVYHTDYPVHDAAAWT
jgi:hypothetical protein